MLKKLSKKNGTCTHSWLEWRRMQLLQKTLVSFPQKDEQSHEGPGKRTRDLKPHSQKYLYICALSRVRAAKGEAGRIHLLLLGWIERPHNANTGQGALLSLKGKGHCRTFCQMCAISQMQKDKYFVIPFIQCTWTGQIYRDSGESGDCHGKWLFNEHHGTAKGKESIRTDSCGARSR